jgi:putative flippase GtrA
VSPPESIPLGGGRRLNLSGPLAGQGLRFLISGGLVALVYTGTTTLLAEVVGIPFEVAIPIGFSIGLVTHFTLQRVFVWTHAEGFALPIEHQLVRYLALAAVQYGVTALSTATLPAALGISTEIVYLATVAVISVVNFVLFRSHVFGAAVAAPEDAHAPRG